MSPLPADGKSTPHADGENSPAADGAAERLARRYPRSRLPRPALLGIIGVCVLGALGWLIWAAVIHSDPDVSGQVVSYRVVSPTKMEVVFTVDQTDPSIEASCLVIAQASDFDRVGEQNVVVEGRPERLVNVTVTLTTLREATSASVKGCTTGG